MASATDATSTIRNPSIKGSPDGCASTQTDAPNTTIDALPQIRFIDRWYRLAGGSACAVLGALFQNVSPAAYRVNQLLGERVIQLGPQSPNVDIHEIRIAFEIDVPHLIGDERSRKNFAGAPGQQRQQQKFLV